MSRFKTSLETSGALDVKRELCIESQRFLCYTRFSDADAQWLIVASDGVDVWRVGLSELDVREYSQERGEIGYLSDVSFKHGVHVVSFQTLPTPAWIAFSILEAIHAGGPAEQNEFSLFELPAAERRIEMKMMLFYVWDHFTATRSKLTECQQELAEVRRQKAPEQPLFADVTLRSGTKVASRPKKPAGHSLVNPSSKRRKAATGVVFGDKDS